MNPLAELYSYIDSKKRQLRGLLSDPFETINQGLLNFRDDQNKLLSDAGVGFQLPGYQSVLLSQKQIEDSAKKATDAYMNQAMAAMAAPAKFIYPQDKALEQARKNGVKMLGLPENNTPMERMLSIARVTSEDAANRAHQFGALDYQAMPISDFRGKLIHKSPSYNRAQSSEYRVGDVGGEPAYMRKSNHWGPFTTNVKEGDPIMNGLKDMGLEVQDVYGRAGKQINNWQLLGGITDKNAEEITRLESTFEKFPRGSAEWFNAYNNVSEKLYKLKHPNKSEAGYIPIQSLVGKVPNKTALINEAGPPFEVPFVTLPNGNIRSRFAAFDPARINENDLLAGALPFGLLSDEETRKKFGF